jgi:hypothetical protein
MRKASFAAVAMFASLLLLAPLAAQAESLGPQGFEAPTFTAGTPLNGADGWTFGVPTNYDVGITDATDGIDGQSLRISNGTMSGSFGDWVFSPHLLDPATDTTGGNQKFTTTFDIQSVTGTDQDMSMNIAPQSLDGARMTNLRFQDGDGGIHVLFSDVLNPAGTVGFQDAPFRTVDIATLPYDGTYTVTIVMNLIEGPHNDVVQVYIEGINGGAGLVPGRPGQVTFDGFYAPVDNQPTTNKAKAGQTIPLKWRVEGSSFATSWEDYYRYDKESNGGLNAPDPIDPINGYGTRDVDSLIIQARGSGGNVLAQGKGYLIDNVTFESAALGTPLPVLSAGVGDASIYGNTPVKYTTLDCNDLDGGGIDAIETYTSNTGGLMYHGNGVWQYNWQTPKAYAGKCVELTLNLGDYTTSFQFTK